MTIWFERHSKWTSRRRQVAQEWSSALFKWRDGVGRSRGDDRWLTLTALGLGLGCPLSSDQNATP